LAEGWALDLLLFQLAERILGYQGLTDTKKSLMIRQLGETELALVEGGSEEINLTSCLSTLATIG